VSAEHAFLFIEISKYLDNDCLIMAQLTCNVIVLGVALLRSWASDYPNTFKRSRGLWGFNAK
jgi:N6-adenosine-specific RNA methylase IME4